MELIQITSRCYYFDAMVKTGLVVNEKGEALLIDTGNDSSAARKINRIIKENGFKVTAILITHAHADHSGGAAFLVKNTGARVYASRPEKSILEYPLGEPFYLFGGAYPPRNLHNKFLLAPPVDVDQMVEPGTVLEEWDAQITDLSGHSAGQVGLACEGVMFCADALIGPEFLEKHGIPLNVDLKRTINTLEALSTSNFSYYLPAHGNLVRDIVPLAKANRNRIEDVFTAVREVLQAPKTVEELMPLIYRRFGVDIKEMGQYYLMNLTLMAYLGALIDQGEITAAYESNRQVFALVQHQA